MFSRVLRNGGLSRFQYVSVVLYDNLNRFLQIIELCGDSVMAVTKSRLGNGLTVYESAMGLNSLQHLLLKGLALF